MRAMTPFEAASRLLRFGPGLLSEREEGRAIKNAIQRVLRRARSRAVNTLRSRGVGRALWGPKGKAKGARLLVKTRRVRALGNRMLTGLDIKGLAAMVEAGGQTKAHDIQPKLRKILRMQIGGKDVFARRVRHPGSRIPPQPFARPELERAEPEFVREIDLSLQQQLNKVLG